MNDKYIIDRRLWGAIAERFQITERPKTWSR